MMMRDKVLLYEELSQNAHPALQTQLYDGWVLRYAAGHKENRINSVNPLYPSSLDLCLKISECEKRYSMQGQPTVFKITETTNPDIDTALKKLEYDIVSPTYVMEMVLRDKDFASGDYVLSEYADDEWLCAYDKFSNKTQQEKTAPSVQIFENIMNTAVYGRIVKINTSVACASMVLECGYMGLLNVVVDERYRGKGYGTEICESLLAAAKHLDAHTAYLQVEQSNKEAVNLYKKLGYEIAYSYWYRIKKLIDKGQQREYQRR